MDNEEQLQASQRFNTRLTLLAVIVLVIVAGAWLVYHNHHTKVSYTKTYHFSQTTSAKLAGSSAGRGITFMRPTGLVNDPVHSNGNDQTAYTYVVSGHPIAYLITGTPSSTPDYQTQILSKAPQSLGDLQNPANSLYLTLPKLYVSTNLARYQITYSSPSLFTNPNISSNAYEVAFTSTDPSTGDKGQGVSILLLGQNSYYLFMLYADTANWQANISTWNQILNSIAIDQ